MTKSVKEIRRFLFDNSGIDTVCFFSRDDMTNSEARRFFFDRANQNEIFTVSQNGNTLYIWG